MAEHLRCRQWERIVTLRGCWKASQWCLVRDRRAFCLHTLLGPGQDSRLMNFWSVASSSNPPQSLSCTQVTSVSCQVKHDRAVNALTSSPSDHMSLIYSCQEGLRGGTQPSFTHRRKAETHSEVTSSSLREPVKFGFVWSALDFSFQRLPLCTAQSSGGAFV